MTRSEFLQTYVNVQRARRGLLPSTVEAAAHLRDRAAAKQVWRDSKQRLERMTPEQWRKLQEAR